MEPFKITPNEFVKECLRTDYKDEYAGVRERLSDKRNARLVHAAIGLTTETGEVNDLVKKTIIYGKELDLTKFKEELSDCLWYIALAIDELDSSFEEVMQMNVNKLRARYPDGFEKDKALNRNIEAEASAMKEKK